MVPPPYARFKRLEPSRQRALLDAAIEEFTERGYEGASLNRVIATAGISKGSFYYYFEDKLDLLVTLFEEQADAGEQLAESGLLRSQDGEEFWLAVERLATGSASLALRRPEVIALAKIFASLSAAQRSSQRVSGFIEASRHHALAVFKHGQRLGVLREDLPVAVMAALWASVDTGLNAWALKRDEALTTEQFEAFCHTCAQMFRRMFERR